MNTTKKIIVTIFSLLIVAIMAPLSFTHATISTECRTDLTKCTTVELGEYIDELTATLNTVRIHLEQLTAGTATSTWCHTFRVNLGRGSSGSEVAALHLALENEGLTVSSAERSGAYFGITTADAVIGFQQKYKDEILTPWGLQYGTGFVGWRTRVKLNQLYGCGVICTQQGSSCCLGTVCASASIDCTEGYSPIFKGCGTDCNPQWVCVLPTTTCTINSDCYPAGFTPGTCGPFYTCSGGKCYEASAACPPAATSTITVLSPNGGESLGAGKTYTVSWQSSNVPSDAYVGRIALYKGANFLIDLVPFLSKSAVSGSIQWAISQNSVIGSDFKIQVILYTGVAGNESVIASDWSNAPFSIVAATTTLNKIVVSLSANPSSPAVNQNVTLTAQVSGCTTGTTNYYYNFYCNANNVTYNQVRTSNTTASTTCQYSSAGTYTAKVKVDKGMDCTQSDYKTLTIPVGVAATTTPPTPTGPVTADIKVNNQDGPITITSGSSVTISWTSTGATSCSVSPTGFVSPGISGSRSTGALTYSQTYTLTCFSGNVSVSDSVKILVTPTTTIPTLPSQPFTSCVLYISSQNLCVGQSYTITGVSNPAGYKYYWYGTKNGVIDATKTADDYWGAGSGITNFSYVSAPLTTQYIGAYKRYFKLFDGDKEVCTSNTVSSTIKDCGVSTATTVPSAPSNLRVSPPTCSKVMLAWNDNSNNESGFKIERKIGTGTFVALTTIGSNITSYEDNGVSPSTIYYYQVRSYNNIGNSAYSTSVRADTPTCPTTTASLTLSSPANNATNVSLTPLFNWSDVTGASSYTLYYRKQGTSGFSYKSGLTASQYQLTVSDKLDVNTTYEWKVVANIGDSQTYSELWKFTTTATLSSAVLNQMAEILESMRLILNQLSE